MKTGFLSIWLLLLVAILGCQSSNKKTEASGQPESGLQSRQYAKSLLTNSRQFTFSGAKSGSGSFSPDGQWMLFQSERESGNPFFQTYLKDLRAGTTTRVSPGYGKTAGGGIHPNKSKILLASTHLDEMARAKQKEKLEQRKSGKRSRYSMDFDENYDLFEATPGGKIKRRLTKAKGYDAEASYSPDGRQIVFVSNRHAFAGETTEAFQKKFQGNPTYGLEIYIMKANGQNVTRLTTSDGYDGGPTFSPDGKRIVWTRFSEDGKTSEIFSMKTDGTDVKQLTNLKAMSWAPSFHPTGDYLIFATSLLGYTNFELFIVDARAEQAPIRATDMEGYDGPPVFLPDGKRVSWARKNTQGQSQIFLADWNDKLARQALSLPAPAILFSPATVSSSTPRVSEILQ